MPSTSIETNRAPVAHPSYVSMQLFGRTGLARVEPIVVRAVDDAPVVPHGFTGFAVTDLDVEHINFASLDPTPIEAEPLPELAWAEVRVNEAPGLFDFWVEVVTAEPEQTHPQETSL